jgi:hypothetical protein
MQRGEIVVGMRSHFLAAYEGLLAQVVYIFDDAVVFVHPPRGVATADFVRLVTTNLGAIHGPSFTGETITQSLAKGYLNDKKFAHIAEFSSQFGDLGFRDPRATSALLADQLDRTVRVLVSDIASVAMSFHPRSLPPMIGMSFALAGGTDGITFWMRYRTEKAKDAHRVLGSLLGERVRPLPAVPDA